MSDMLAVMQALAAQYPLPEVECNHHQGEGEGPFTRDILGERLQAWEDNWEGAEGERFTYDDTQAKDGFQVWCPGNFPEGWDGTEDTIHGGMYEKVNDSTIVYVENGWPKFSCRHNHCGEGAAQGKKTWLDLQNYYDPRREFHRMEREVIDLNDPRMPVEFVVDEPEAETAAPVRKGLYAMPESCMYGWCGQKARELCTPLGYAYPAIVTVFAAMIERTPSFIRPTSYTCLIGPVACAKSETIKRALASINLIDPGKVRWTVPGSDRGLIRIFGGKKEEPKKKGEEEDFFAPPEVKTRLLAQDELRNTIAKANISGSSLPATLCTLWSQDEAGAADKTGEHVVLVKLNILGALKAADPEEFAEVFGKETTAGLYDRFVYGIAPTTWKYNRWVAKPEIHCATGPSCSDAVFKMVDDWRDVDPKSRRRLSEIALRWAYITAAANQDKEITVEGMTKALEFATWQENIRQGFRAGLGDAIDAQCTNAILSVLEQTEGWVRWKEVSLKKNWYRKYGASVLARTRDSLSKSGETFEETVETEPGKFKRTGRLRLRKDEDVW